MLKSDRVDRLVDKATITNGLRLERSEVLNETLPVGTKPRTSLSPGGERHGKRKHKTIFLERMREGHHQSNKHCNHFKGNVEKTSERWGGVHMGFCKCNDTILNCTEQNSSHNVQLAMEMTFSTHPCYCVCVMASLGPPGTQLKPVVATERLDLFKIQITRMVGTCIPCVNVCVCVLGFSNHS